MSSDRQRAARFLVVGGLAWQPFLAVEKLGDFHKGSAGWYVDQLAFFVATVVLLVGLMSLGRSGVAGDRRFGRVSTRVLVIAWTLVTLGALLQLCQVYDASDAVTGIGGLLSYPAALCTGVAIARAHVLEGVRRWVAVLQGVYMFAAILLPAVVFNADPSWAVEATWQLGWVAVSLALSRPSTELATPIVGVPAAA